MSKRLDPDFKAIKQATRALQGSSSLRMLRANMAYLWDRFVAHPKREDVKRILARVSQENPSP